MWIKSGFYAAIILFGTIASASAGPYYQALTATGVATPGISFTGGMAVADSIQATTGKLSEIEISLAKANNGGNLTGSVVITLNADNGLSGTADGPGAVLYTIGTIADNNSAFASNGTEYIFDFYGMGIVNLSSTATYWVEISRNGSGLTELKTFNDPSAPSVGATNSSTLASNLYDTRPNAGSFSVINAVSPSGPEMQLCASSDNTCFSGSANSNGVSISLAISDTGVPEPATMAVLGTGLVGLGLSRRRAKAKQAALAQA